MSYPREDLLRMVDVPTGQVGFRKTGQAAGSIGTLGVSHYDCRGSWFSYFQAGPNASVPSFHRPSK